ncbi:hypothetical protein [Streptomyces blastmyceticus]|uniref:Uncharacterized protein n=1 Tax=Streptomyces blastmyceticus TaxID=68180 RepID=A0ABN0XFL0_9ACTN
MIDNTKDLAWPSGDRSVIAGRMFRAGMTDDRLDPARLSARDVDLEIARVLRAAMGC